MYKTSNNWHIQQHDKHVKRDSLAKTVATSGNPGYKQTKEQKMVTAILVITFIVVLQGIVQD